MAVAGNRRDTRSRDNRTDTKGTDMNTTKKLSITDEDLKQAGITKRGRLKGRVYTQAEIDRARIFYGQDDMILLRLLLQD